MTCWIVLSNLERYFLDMLYMIIIMTVILMMMMGGGGGGGGREIEKLLQVLKVFKDTTNIILGSEYPTSNLFLSEVHRIVG